MCQTSCGGVFVCTHARVSVKKATPKVAAAAAAAGQAHFLGMLLTQAAAACGRRYRGVILVASVPVRAWQTQLGAAKRACTAAYAWRNGAARSSLQSLVSCLLLAPAVRRHGCPQMLLILLMIAFMFPSPVRDIKMSMAHLHAQQQPQAASSSGSSSAGGGTFVYNIVLDAGSTGSRIHIFKFRRQAGGQLELMSDGFHQVGEPLLGDSCCWPSSSACCCTPARAVGMRPLGRLACLQSAHARRRA